MELVSGHTNGIDIKIACQCVLHYECLVRYIRNQLGDRISLLRHGKEGILCPYIISETCRYKNEFRESNRQLSMLSSSSRSSVESKLYFISLSDMDWLVDFGARLANNRIETAGVKALLKENVDQMRRWIEEGYFGNELNDESGMDLLQLATTKRCPGCNYRGTHYHGHHCHHISSGCPLCGTHYCYRCLSSESENITFRNKSSNCKCGKIQNISPPLLYSPLMDSVDSLVQDIGESSAVPFGI